MNIKEKWLTFCRNHVSCFFSFRRAFADRLRLQRLFVVACCERIRHLAIDKRSLKALEIVELYADGQTTAQELTNAHNNAWNAYCEHDKYNLGNSCFFKFCYDQIHLATMQHEWLSAILIVLHLE